MKPYRKLLSSVIVFTMSAHLLHAAADITIGSAANLDITLSTPFQDASNNGGPSNLNTSTLTTALGSSSVLVTTTSGGIAPTTGRITVLVPITWSNVNSLSLAADSIIAVDATVTNNGGGGFVLTAAAGVAFNSDVILSGGASNLSVVSQGITQAPLRKLLISGLADLNAGSAAIMLPEANNFGSIKLTGSVVTVNEVSASTLAGVAATTSFNLTSAGAITDLPGATIGVTGLATLNAGANPITLGDVGGGTTNFGSLNLTGTVLAIIEDSGTELAGVTGATSLTLTSNGAITDTGNISVSGLAIFKAGTNAIILGDAGEMTNFGTLNISGGAVSISEDSAMDLVGINTAASAVLSATGALSDAGATSLAVSGLGSFSGTSISLGGGSFNSGTLTFNSAGAVTIHEDSAMDIVSVNTGGATTLTSTAGISDAGATSVNVGALTVSGTSISLGGGIFNATTLNFNSAGAVTIQEDSSSLLTGTSTGLSVAVISAGALTNDATASLTATNNANFGGTSISLGTVAGDTMNFGSLTFNSSGAVTIQEDSSTQLSGASTGLSLALTSAGAITDVAGSSLTVTGAVGITAGTATSITLDDTVFNVGGNTTFTAGNGQEITANNAANIFTGTVIFASSGTLANVNVFDTTALNLQASLTLTGSLTARSGAALTDNGDLTVAGLATLGGGSISIGGGTKATNFGSLNINSTGAVTIQEDSSTLLTGTGIAGSLALTTTGAITDNPGTSLTVTDGSSMTATGSITLNNAATDVLSVGGNAAFSGTTITLGSAGTANFGSLTFTSGGVVMIQEDSDTALNGTSTANSLGLTTTGAITDNPGTSLTVTNGSAMTATGAIALNDTATDVLSVGGNAAFSGTAITVGSAGTANFGSLTFTSGGAVIVQEDSDTLLTGANTANSLDLKTTGAITDNSGMSLTVTDGSSMTATGAITLNNTATDVLSVGGNAAFSGTAITLGSAGTANFGSLTFSSGGAVIVQEDSDTALNGTSTANSLDMKTTGAITDNPGTSLTVTDGSLMTATGAITLNDTATDVLNIGGNAAFSGTAITLGSAGTANFGSLTFTSAGGVTVQEDSDTLLTGVNTANNLDLKTTGAITDNPGTSLTVTDGSAMTATGTITLNDTATDVLSVGGNAAFSGTAITLGSAGSANFGSLTFNATGAVTTQEDSDTLLTSTNAADSLGLYSSGAITDNTGTSLTVTNGSIMLATGVITLNDTATDVLSVGGNATFSGTAISLGSAGTANFGSLTFMATGAVSIHEDSVTLLTRRNSAYSLGLTTSGAITDNTGTTGTSLWVTDGSAMTATGAITLNDSATDVLSIGGNAAFTGSAITLGSAGMANFGSLTFTSAGAVSIQEDSSTLLTGISTGLSLALNSREGITNDASATLAVTNLASFSATSITLGTTAGDTMNFGSLTFNSAGAVTIEEDSSILLTGTSTGLSLALGSTAGITNDATVHLAVTNNATFTGTSISLGTTAGDIMNFGSLTFSSAGVVTIQEDSDTLLTGANTANSLDLKTTGAITDNPGTSLTVTDGSAMTATGAITLNDTATDVLSVGGNAAFSGTAITVGSAGTANFGSLTFTSGGAVIVQEDSDTALSGTSTANSFDLTTTGAITDSTGTSLTVTDGSLMTATGAITLNDAATEVLSVGGNAAFSGTAITVGSAGAANFGSLTFTSAGAVTVQEDSDTALNGTSTANSLDLKTTGAITDNPGTSLTVTDGSSMTATGAITLNDTAADVLNVAGNAAFSGTAITVGSAGTANFGSLTFTSAGVVTIQEDSDTFLTGSNTANSLGLITTGAITDSTGMSLIVTDDSLMTATGAITLNDTATDVMRVDGNAAFSGTAITLGSAGTANFGSLTFNSGGAVIVQEDSDTALNGTSTANSLDLTTSGAITDSTGMSLAVLDGSSMTATGAITLNDTASDVLNIGGNAAFNGTAISLGSAGAANFGSLTFNSAGAVTIQEDSDMVLNGSSTADRLALTSAGALTDSGNLSVAGLATFRGASITLGGAGLTTHFGSLTVNSTGTVAVQEDSDTQFVGASTASILTLTSSGVSTFTSGSTLDATSLEIQTQSVVLTGNNLVDTIGVRLANGTTLTLNGADTIGTLIINGGTLAGSAALTATGGAALNGGTISGHLLADTTTTGTVLVSGTVGGGFLHVNSGTLTLTGTASSNTTVKVGATLKGTGLVNGNLTNYGTLAVGSMGGKLTVSGKLKTRGNIALSLDDSSNFEKIKVGSANLGGSLLVTNTGSGLANGEMARIINAGSYSNGVDSFTTIDFDNGLLFNDRTGTLIGLAGGDKLKNGGYLNLTESQSDIYLALFEDSVQLGVQNVIRSGSTVRFTSGATNGDPQLVSALYQATFTTPGTIDIDTVTSLSPEVHRGMGDYTEQALRSHVREAADAAPVSRKGKTQVFATLHSNSDGVDDSVTNAGYDTEMFGATGGVRYDVNGNLRIGGLLGVDDGNIKGALIDTDAQGFALGGFGRYLFDDKGKTTVTGSASFGNYAYDAARRSFGGDAKADDIGSDAIELVLGVSTVVYEKDRLRVSPGGAFRYMTGSVDGFEENGPGVPLTVDSQDIEALLIDVGVDLNYQLQDKLSLVGRVGYVSDLSSSDESVSASFAASGPDGLPFSVSAPGIDNQAITLGLGLFYDINDNTRMGVTYRGEFRTDSLSSQTFGIGASYGF